MSNPDLLQSALACRRVLEIVVEVLGKRVKLWDKEGALRVTSKSFVAAKLWLWSKQGGQTPSGIELSMEFLDLEGLGSCIQFLILAAPHQFATIRLDLNLQFSHPITVQRSLLKHFFSLVHNCAPRKVYLSRRCHYRLPLILACDAGVHFPSLPSVLQEI